MWNKESFEGFGKVTSHLVLGETDLGGGSTIIPSYPRTRRRTTGGNQFLDSIFGMEQREETGFDRFPLKETE